MVCAAVNVFDQGTEDVILALEDVAAEATKPLVGVFLDFHPPLMSGGTPDENAATTRAILAGERGPSRDLAVINAGTAIYAAGRAESPS